MDLIERLFGVWPDGGDGSLELLLIVAAVAVVSVFVFRRQLRATQFRMCQRPALSDWTGSAVRCSSRSVATRRRDREDARATSFRRAPESTVK
jgi:hypothetical protein